MLTVSNTSPLLNLAIINRLDLLEKQFKTIYIPEAVLTELRVEENLQGSLYLKAAIDKQWLQVKAVTNKPLVQLLQRELDRGQKC